MDLMKSTHSEIYPRIYQKIWGLHPKQEDVMMRWMNRVEIKEIDPKQTDLWSVFRSVFWEIQVSEKPICMKVEQTEIV